MLKYACKAGKDGYVAHSADTSRRVGVVENELRRRRGTCIKERHLLLSAVSSAEIIRE